MMATDLPGGEVVDHHMPVLSPPGQEIAPGREVQAHGVPGHVIAGGIEVVTPRHDRPSLAGMDVPEPDGGASRRQRAVRGEGHGSITTIEGESYRSRRDVPHLEGSTCGLPDDRAPVGRERDGLGAPLVPREVWRLS